MEASFEENRLVMARSQGFESVEAYETAYLEWVIDEICTRIFLCCMELMGALEA